MEVEVKLYAMLREIASKKLEKVDLPEKASMRDLIGFMISKYGEEFGTYIYDADKKVRNYLSYMINGVNINSLDGFETTLKDGDVISLLPPVGGG